MDDAILQSLIMQALAGSAVGAGSTAARASRPFDPASAVRASEGAPKFDPMSTVRPSEAMPQQTMPNYGRFVLPGGAPIDLPSIQPTGIDLPFRRRF